jgi:hypothetical protein
MVHFHISDFGFEVCYRPISKFFRARFSFLLALTLTPLVKLADTRVSVRQGTTGPRQGNNSHLL